MHRNRKIAEVRHIYTCACEKVTLARAQQIPFFYSGRRGRVEGCCLLARCSLAPAAATAAARSVHSLSLLPLLRAAAIAAACSVHSLSLLPLVPAANIAAACSVPLALLVAVAAAACRCSVRSCLPLLLAAKSLERDVRKRSQNKQLRHGRCRSTPGRHPSVPRFWSP